MNIKDYLLLVVIAGPFICAAIGYGLEGSWQGVLLGAGSGMLLGGVLRRLIGKMFEEPESDDIASSSKPFASNSSEPNKKS